MLNWRFRLAFLGKFLRARQQCGQLSEIKHNFWCAIRVLFSDKTRDKCAVQRARTFRVIGSRKPLAGGDADKKKSLKSYFSAGNWVKYSQRRKRAKMTLVQTVEAVASGNNCPIAQEISIFLWMTECKKGEFYCTVWRHCRLSTTALWKRVAVRGRKNKNCSLISKVRLSGAKSSAGYFSFLISGNTNSGKRKKGRMERGGKKKRVRTHVKSRFVEVN